MSDVTQATADSSQAYAWGVPECTARFKLEPGDFCVDEELGYLPDGSGEHLCLQVRKTGITTQQVVQRLTRFFDVREVAIGYAGLKDRQGICTQWFSICLPARRAPAVEALNDATLHALQSGWNSRKIRLGTHQGNRFGIRLRALNSDRQEDSTALAAADRDALVRRLEIIRFEGVPNYFGEQRFGRDGDNPLKAQAWFEGRYRPTRFERGMLLSAARSYVFNAVLSRRVAAGSWNAFVTGDVMNLQGTESIFVPEIGEGSSASGRDAEGGRKDASESERLAELQARVAAKDIHPTGPLWGRGELRSSADVRALEQEIAEANKVLCGGLESHGLQQSRRALRLLPHGLEYAWSDRADELTVSFSLPPGAYATAVLREICRT